MWHNNIKILVDQHGNVASLLKHRRLVIYPITAMQRSLYMHGPSVLQLYFCLDFSLSLSANVVDKLHLQFCFGVLRLIL